MLRVIAFVVIGGTVLAGQAHAAPKQARALWSQYQAAKQPGQKLVMEEPGGARSATEGMPGRTYVMEKASRNRKIMYEFLPSGDVKNVSINRPGKNRFYDGARLGKLLERLDAAAAK